MRRRKNRDLPPGYHISSHEVGGYFTVHQLVYDGDVIEEEVAYALDSPYPRRRLVQVAHAMTREPRETRRRRLSRFTS